jgi:hypothetical protein
MARPVDWSSTTMTVLIAGVAALIAEGKTLTCAFDMDSPVNAAQKDYAPAPVVSSHQVRNPSNFSQ